MKMFFLMSKEYREHFYDWKYLVDKYNHWELMQEFDIQYTLISAMSDCPLIKQKMYYLCEILEHKAESEEMRNAAARLKTAIC